MSEEAIKSLCVKLQNLLTYEIKQGNRVIAVETGWSKVVLAVRLANPLDMEHLKKVAENDKDLEIWESRDIKYPQEAGILCKSARQSLSGGIIKK